MATRTTVRVVGAVLAAAVLTVWHVPGIGATANQAPAKPAAQEPAGAPREEWDDPAVLHVNTERPHATMATYPSADLARRGEPGASPWIQSLNGTWKFRYSPNPAARPVGFERVGFDDKAWAPIA